MSRFVLDHKFWLFPLLAWALVVSLSAIWNLAEIRRSTHQLALHEGRFVFGMIQATREWNARHGGVYGLMDENTPANPYLNVAERDLKTPTGKTLTLLNPTYMTRQLGDLVLEQTGIRIHITSLHPLNPDNLAEDWEVDALRAFGQGAQEFFVMPERRAGAAAARYAAPLVTRPACLQCHHKQGYRVGDIRGGITVVYPIDTLLSVQKTRSRQIVLVHGLAWLLLSGVTIAALLRMRQQMLSLRAARDDQQALVEQRTAELRAEVIERHEAESSLRMLINASGEGIFGMDRQGRCSFCNPVAAELLGYDDTNRLLGRNILNLIKPESADGTQNAALLSCDMLCKFEAIHEDEAWFVRADGDLLPVEYRAHPIMRDGLAIGAVVTFADITERKRTQDRIWRQANFDPLTGLSNRALMHDRLDSALAQAHRRNERLAVLFVDLDKFKEANDRLGHAAGDHVLREAARRLSACLRDTDTVARLGGDEFLIVLPLVEHDRASETVAAKIVGSLAEPIMTLAGQAEISASIGIAHYPDDATTREALIRAADLAMYRAKEAGRNTYSVFGGAPQAD